MKGRIFVIAFLMQAAAQPGRSRPEKHSGGPAESRPDAATFHGGRERSCRGRTISGVGGQRGVGLCQQRVHPQRGETQSGAGDRPRGGKPAAILENAMMEMEAYASCCWIGSRRL